MTIRHTVIQGEHVARIARQYGLVGHQTVWNHPENGELRKNRDDPNVLFPGDTIVVPEPELKEEPGATDRRHRFRMKLDRLKLRVVVRNVSNKPMAGVPCVLHVEAAVFELRTRADGLIERPIPEMAETAVAILADPSVPPVSLSLPLKIGYLDPVTTVPGQVARLNNLGYDAGLVGREDRAPRDEEGQRQFRSAVEEFQCDHGLAVDGKCGPVTQVKLKKVHGC